MIPHMNAMNKPRSFAGLIVNRVFCNSFSFSFELAQKPAADFLERNYQQLFFYHEAAHLPWRHFLSLTGF